jgi:cytochrome c-type biogenesis protein
MNELFTSLTQAVESTPAIAMGAALLWGILSILLSPCHLASIPLIVGFIDDQGRTTPRRALLISLLFATGILATIAAIGAITAAAGRMMGDIGGYANYAVAVIFFVVGLGLLGVIPLGWKKPENAGGKQKGLLAAFLLGLIFGIALGPCSFAYMAPMLGITFKLGAQQPVYAAGLLLMYGIGHCGVIALAGVSTGWIQKYRDWNDQSRGATRLKKICGILVILGGLYLIYTAP